MNVLKMKVGKELDLMVAQQVMGWNVDHHDIPDFSSDIKDVWAVVEKSRVLQFPNKFFKDSQGNWCVELDSGLVIKEKSAALVICKAALIKNSKR
ncbi:BC1872 family protein [Melghirimyces profundicolus]|nr:hypothetical protein [Melghirimyces profundicolus]